MSQIKKKTNISLFSHLNDVCIFMIIEEILHHYFCPYQSPYNLENGFSDQISVFGKVYLPLMPDSNLHNKKKIMAQNNQFWKFLLKICFRCKNCPLLNWSKFIWQCCQILEIFKMIFFKISKLNLQKYWTGFFYHKPFYHSHYFFFLPVEIMNKLDHPRKKKFYRWQRI